MLRSRLLPLLVCLAATLPPQAKAEGMIPAKLISATANAQISAAIAPMASQTPTQVSAQVTRPRARQDNLPAMAWGTQNGSLLWTRAALSALQGPAARLTEIVPRDIAAWCPAYPQADRAQRAAFWAGFASALARFESGHRAGAVGGGGLYHGLLQILPATAAGHGCDARSGPALQNGGANLSCGLRIMARTVARDRVIARDADRWGGVAADWGPLRSTEKRAQMQDWLKRQTYCRPLSATRPQVRPAHFRIAQSSEKG
jgi:hypothetical protein